MHIQRKENVERVWCCNRSIMMLLYLKCDFYSIVILILPWINFYAKNVLNTGIMCGIIVQELFLCVKQMSNTRKYKYCVVWDRLPFAVQQMIGRAGRPGFDVEGHAIIMTQVIFHTKTYNIPQTPQNFSSVYHDFCGFFRIILLVCTKIFQRSRLL